MKHGDVMSVFEKLPDDERTYETRSAQDNDARHVPIVCATARFRFTARETGPLRSSARARQPV